MCHLPFYKALDVENYKILVKYFYNIISLKDTSHKILIIDMLCNYNVWEFSMI